MTKISGGAGAPHTRLATATAAGTASEKQFKTAVGSSRVGTPAAAGRAGAVVPLDAARAARRATAMPPAAYGTAQRPPFATVGSMVGLSDEARIALMANGGREERLPDVAVIDVNGQQPGPDRPVLIGSTLCLSSEQYDACKAGAASDQFARTFNDLVIRHLLSSGN
ncbi:hypothetical protein [Zhengella mangrovi]|nr:hypothetical protein [Zhengella mangrovi]